MVLNLKLLISTSLLVSQLKAVSTILFSRCVQGTLAQNVLTVMFALLSDGLSANAFMFGKKTGCEDKWFFGNKFGALKMWFWTGSSEILKIMSLPVITMLYNGPKRHFISKDHLLIFLCISQIFPKVFWEMFLICTHTWQMDLKATVQASVYGTDANPGHVENKL